MAGKKGLKLGRPKTYETARQLQRAIEDYLNSSARTVPVLDNRGKPVTNDRGEPMESIQYVRPLTVAGMCVALGITPRTWENYCNPDKHPEFQEVTEAARTVLVAYSTQAMLVDPKNARAHQFNLMANYGVGAAEKGGTAGREEEGGGQSIESYLASLGGEPEF